VTRAPLDPLDPQSCRDRGRRARRAAIGSGVVTTAATVDAAHPARAILLAKSPAVIAGLDVAIEAFRQLDSDVAVRIHHRDGTLCAPGTAIAEIQGRAASLLTAERTALNFMQRMTGVATLTRHFVDAAAGRITVLDTRKTTPLMRTLEKYAVRAGGGVNHRFGLSDGVLIKDNHVRLAGGVCAAVSRMRASNPGMPIEVEAQSLSEVADALQARADIVLLDNLTTPEIIDAVRQCRGRAKTEISGGVTLARMPELAATGADFVSIGALTHSAPAADLSLEIGI
jgi:nicotinate-nucleotide pyrophosphorylase (carboxylating)